MEREKKNLEKAVTQLESPMMIMIVMMMQTLMVESEDTTENLRVVHPDLELESSKEKVPRYVLTGKIFYSSNAVK